MLAREVEYNFNFMKYSEELTKAMDFLGKDPRTLFLGQAVEYPGTACLLYTSPSPRDRTRSRMPSSA